MFFKFPSSEIFDCQNLDKNFNNYKHFRKTKTTMIQQRKNFEREGP